MPLRVATFALDVTPPPGCPLCGALVPPAAAIDDPLQAIGVVLLGHGQPIVQIVLDWTALWNESHQAWQTALAQAAGTLPQRVMVSCLHPHDAPMADLHAHRLLVQHRGLGMIDVGFHDRSLRAAAEALRQSLPRARPVTHVSATQAIVQDVASNRRIVMPDGRVQNRFSACKDAALRAAPAGLIDPWLKTITLYDGDQPVAALSSYACHPMSHYGAGRVSCDFFGLARNRRQSDDPRCARLLLNGCLGDLSAGKFNDGDPANRAALTQRMYDALLAADSVAQPQPIEHVAFASLPLDLPRRDDAGFDEPALTAILEDAGLAPGAWARAALGLSRLHRLRQGPTLNLAALAFNNAVHLQLVGEPFIHYQLEAQRLAPDRFVMVSALSDDSPGYIPTDEGYVQGGYEPTTSYVGPVVQQRLLSAVAELLRQV
jgi:hypothetical protein